MKNLSVPLAPVSTPKSVAVRDPRLDFYRGLALLVLTYDHIMERLDTPAPFFLRITPYHWGLFSAASMFVFISGQAYGLAFGRLFDRSGFRAILAKSLRRVAKLYGANLLTFAIMVLSVTSLCAASLAAGPLVEKLLGYEKAYGFAGMFAAVAGFVVVPDFFNILPLYMLLLTAAPFVVWGLARQPWWTLAISVGLYAASRFGFTGQYSQFWEDRTYFNPVPWQMQFVLGIAIQRLTFEVRPNRILLWAALVVVVCVAILKAVIPGLVNFGVISDSALWEVPHSWSKSLRPQLPFIRVLYFLMVAYVGAVLVARDSSFWQKVPVRAITTMGRNSLLVFCFTVVFTWTADVLIAALHAGWPGALVAVAVSIFASWGIARLAELPKKATPVVALDPPASV